MKKISLMIFLSAVLMSCQHDLTTMTDFNVTLDPSNTYLAGEPVRFNFSGDVDNIVFYSGVAGSEYQHKDRYVVPMESVDSVILSLDIQARYGKPGAMEIYVSNTFAGLKGNDPKADKDTLKSLYKRNMPGWTRLKYKEGASQQLTSHVYDSLALYKENLTLAFHWCPKSYYSLKDSSKRENEADSMAYEVQRTYWVNGRVDLTIKDMPKSQIDISELEFMTVMLNDEVQDPYRKNSGNGSIILNTPSTASLVFQGVSATDSLKYAIDAWAVSAPHPMNNVENDKGVVIKNQQNYLHSYEYVWNEPGTYKITFVGTGANHIDNSEEVKELTVVILENVQ